jgi:hypothetical protein
MNSRIPFPNIFQSIQSGIKNSLLVLLAIGFLFGGISVKAVVTLTQDKSYRLDGNSIDSCDKAKKTCSVEGATYTNCEFKSGTSIGGDGVGVEEDYAVCVKISANGDGVFGKANGRPFVTKEDNGVTCEIYTKVADTNTNSTADNLACGKKDNSGKYVYDEKITQTCDVINPNKGFGRNDFQLSCNDKDALIFKGGEKIPASFLDGNQTIVLRDGSGKNITLSFDDIKYQFCVKDSGIVDRIGDIFTLNARDLTAPSRVADRCKYFEISKSQFLSGLNLFCQGKATGLPNATAQSEVDKVKVAETSDQIKNDPTKSNGVAGLPSDTTAGAEAAKAAGGIFTILYNIILTIIYILLILVRYVQMLVLLLISGVMASLLSLSPTTSFIVNIGTPLWSTFVNLANLGAIAILIYLGAATMIGIMKTEQAIKGGTQVAIYVLISQFTYLGLAFIIAMVDNFTKVVVTVFAGGNVFNIFIALFTSIGKLDQINTEGALLPDILKSAGSVAGLAFQGKDITSTVVSEAIIIIVLTFLMMAFWNLFTMVAARMTILLILMITSPIWVLGYLVKDALPGNMKSNLDKLVTQLYGAVLFNFIFVVSMVLLAVICNQVAQGFGKMVQEGMFDQLFSTASARSNTGGTTNGGGAAGGAGNAIGNLATTLGTVLVPAAIEIYAIFLMGDVLKSFILPELAAAGESARKFASKTMMDASTGNSKELVKTITGGVGRAITGGNDLVTNTTSLGMSPFTWAGNKLTRDGAIKRYDAGKTELKSLTEQRQALIAKGDSKGAMALDQKIANANKKVELAKASYKDGFTTFGQKVTNLTEKGEIAGFEAGFALNGISGGRLGKVNVDAIDQKSKVGDDIKANAEAEKQRKTSIEEQELSYNRQIQDDTIARNKASAVGDFETANILQKRIDDYGGYIKKIKADVVDAVFEEGKFKEFKVVAPGLETLKSNAQARSDNGYATKQGFKVDVSKQGTDSASWSKDMSYYQNPPAPVQQGPSAEEIKEQREQARNQKINSLNMQLADANRQLISFTAMYNDPSTPSDQIMGIKQQINNMNNTILGIQDQINKA